MKGTVNGKSLDQVLSELKAPFPEEELKKNEKMKRIFRLKAWRAV
ncbi:MAG: hypothetical protein ACLUD0_13345 [Eubacterium ramulus]